MRCPPLVLVPTQAEPVAMPTKESSSVTPAERDEVLGIVMAGLWRPVVEHDG
ncbi:hypothetical protein ACVDFE_23005 [Lentzea chajnantorensis]